MKEIKKIGHFVALLWIGAMLMVSCDKEKPDPALTFSIASESLMIENNGGEFVVDISGNVEWQASCDAPWLTVTPGSGKGGTQCTILADSSVIADFRGAKILFLPLGLPPRHVTVRQEGYNKGIYLSSNEEIVPNYEKIDDRFFELEVSANVPFDVVIPEEVQWIRHEEEERELDYGFRPRTFTLRFNWDVNMREEERSVEITLKPDEEAQVEPVSFTVTQNAAPSLTDDRAGDSIAILSVYEALNGMFGWDRNSNMRYWENVKLWTEADRIEVDGEMRPVPEEMLGRVREVQFIFFNTEESIPGQVRQFKYAEKIAFKSNANTHIKDIALGSEICELAEHGNLNHLEITSYGISSLPDDFPRLGKSLVSLNLSSNNLQSPPSWLTAENFPKLKSLSFYDMRRRTYMVDLYNAPADESIGMRLHTDDDFFIELIRWSALEELHLAVSYLEGMLPDDWELTMWPYSLPVYTEEDFEVAHNKDTIIDAKEYLLGAPKVWPNMRQLSINLNFLNGFLPDWILYHPYLSWWTPYALVFPQEEKGFNSYGIRPGFDNVPSNLLYYYELYPKRK